MLESLVAAMRESDLRMTCIKDTVDALVKRTDTLESEVFDMLKRRDAREIENRSDKEELTGLSRTVEDQAALITEMRTTLLRTHTDNSQILRCIEELDGHLSTVNNRLTSLEGRMCGLFDDLKTMCLAYMAEKHEELIRQCIFL
jgi:chromosome segregation ATPase